MDNDLSDVGLNALEALEAQDELEETNAENEDAGNTEDSPENASDEAEGKDGAEEGEDTSEEPSEPENGEEEAPEEPKKDKELSDEEFEEMAKKRGYAKSKSEDEANAEDEQKSRMEELLARPDEIDEKLWAKLPDENKLIYNALPYIEAQGKKGKVMVKTPDQLPEGFEFRSDKARMTFQNDLQAQENRASQMQNALRARAEREQMDEARRAEAQVVISEIDKLQKSGELPTPKAKSGTAEFDNDPAVLLINKVLNYRSMRASQGANLSVRDSYLLYKAEHPEDFVKKEAKGDIERRNVAKKVAGNSKASSSAVNGDDDNKPHYYRPGMTTEEVLDNILSDMD